MEARDLLDRQRRHRAAVGDPGGGLGKGTAIVGAPSPRHRGLPCRRPPDVTHSTSRRTSSGCSSAIRAAITPPIDWATRSTGSVIRAVTAASGRRAPEWRDRVAVVPPYRASRNAPSTRRPAAPRRPASRSAANRPRRGEEDPRTIHGSSPSLLMNGGRVRRRQEVAAHGPRPPAGPPDGRSSVPQA